jgi:hypothetical protein
MQVNYSMTLLRKYLRNNFNFIPNIKLEQLQSDFNFISNIKWVR